MTDQKYNISLTINELNIVATALRKMPYDTVAELLMNIQQQVQKVETEAKTVAEKRSKKDAI